MDTTNRILGLQRSDRRYHDILRGEDPGAAFRYARDVIKGPWPEAEPFIATHPLWSYNYAHDVIDGPWPPGEDAIATDPLAGYCYARFVIQGPWEPCEKLVVKEARYSSQYAVKCLKRRWPEAEKTIASHEITQRYYLTAFPDAKDDWVANGWMDWMDT